MATKVWVAAVHAIGEDNEGNMAFVARTRAALEAKLVSVFKNMFDGDEDFAGDQWNTLDTWADTYDWTINEEMLED